MKTKITKKPKTTLKAKSTRLTKKAKISLLIRKAAGRSRSNRKRVKALAQQHLAIAILLALVTLGTSSLAFAISINLVPPPSAAGKYPAAEEVLKRYIVEYEPQNKPNPPNQVGIASWYALGLRAPDALTCASTTFPRGTYLKVKNIRNGKEVVCLVNDYGPQPWTKKVIDLSRGSFVRIANLGSGVAPVEIRVVPKP